MFISLQFCIKVGIGLVLVLLTMVNVYLSVIKKLATSTITFHEYEDNRKLDLEDLPDLKICPILGFTKEGALSKILKNETSQNLTESEVEELVQSYLLKREDFITKTSLFKPKGIF